MDKFSQTFPSISIPAHFQLLKKFEMMVNVLFKSTFFKRESIPKTVGEVLVNSISQHKHRSTPEYMNFLLTALFEVVEYGFRFIRLYTSADQEIDSASALSILTIIIYFIQPNIDAVDAKTPTGEARAVTNKHSGDGNFDTSGSSEGQLNSRISNLQDQNLPVIERGTNYQAYLEAKTNLIALGIDINLKLPQLRKALITHCRQQNGLNELIQALSPLLDGIDLAKLEELIQLDFQATRHLET